MKTKLIILFIAVSSLVKGQYTILYNFTSTFDPYGILTFSGHKMYGMTCQKGLYNKGCIFSIDTNGSNYKDLHDFVDSTGAQPQGSLTLAGGVLYGMTFAGGKHDTGCIFSIDTNGNNYRDIFDFDGINGSRPFGDLTLSGKTLYGMADGGANDLGTVFSIDTNGTNYKDLLDFNGTNGKYAVGSLTMVGKLLYGMTSIGGLNDKGRIFSIDINGNNYRDIFDFNGTDGTEALGKLTLSGNMLYGTTYAGGSLGLGTIFSIDINGSKFKQLGDFNDTNGVHPEIGALALSGNKLYGMAIQGGVDNKGCIYSIDTNGNNFTDVFDFDGTNGENPMGGLVVSGNLLYGMTQAGGNSQFGVIFSFNVITAGLDNLQANQEIINVYPNPSNGNFTLTYSLNGNGNVRTTIVNELGQIVYDNTEQKSSGSINEQLNLENLAAGIYSLRLQTGNSIMVRRVVVMENR